MILKNDLLKFKEFCANRHNIKIQESVIEEFLHSITTNEYNNASVTGNKLEMKCGYDATVCAHVNFNSVKCDACSY